MDNETLLSRLDEIAAHLNDVTLGLYDNSLTDEAIEALITASIKVARLRLEVQ